MGFRPNVLAASLRNKKTKTIGVLISRINRPFLSSLISGIEETLQNAGYNTIIIQSNDSYKNEVNMTKVLYSNRVSGVICSLAMETQNTVHFQQFINSNIPLVFVDRVPKDIDACRVMIDNYSAGYKATQHLIDQGCTRIAHFAGLQHINIYKNRTKGYLDALEKHGLPYNEQLIIFGDLKEGSGDAAVNTLYERGAKFDGIFSSSDFAAIWAMKNLQARGVRIPEDVAIIGFSNEPFTALVTPALSTVNQFTDDIGSSVANLFLKEIGLKKEQRVAKKVVLTPEIIVRASSLKQ